MRLHFTPLAMALFLTGSAAGSCARAAQADQSLGDCEWFSKDEAAALLGTAGLTIQRHGPTLCMASSARPSAVLMVAAPGRIDAEARATKRRNDDEICTVTPMPELGAQAYVAHACRMLPGKPPLPNMEAYVQKNGRYAEIVYVPGGGRPAGSADLTLLIPVMRRTLGGL